MAIKIVAGLIELVLSTSSATWPPRQALRKDRVDRGANRPRSQPGCTCRKPRETYERTTPNGAAKERPLISSRDNAPGATIVAIIRLAQTHTQPPLGSRDASSQTGRQNADNIVSYSSSFFEGTAQNTDRKGDGCYAKAMPRQPRVCPAGVCFHVLNRAVARLTLFGPIRRPRQWRSYVNRPQSEAELAAIRHSLRHGTAFGSEAWVTQSAARLKLKHTLRPRGRPKAKQ